MEECLISVANQTHTNKEHLVIDGSSSDGTLSILQRHKEKIDVLISEPDNGIYDALNKGLARATGDIVGFLHADDLYSNNDVLAKVSAMFETDDKISAVYGNLDYVSKDNIKKIVRRWQSEPFTSSSLSLGWMPPHPTLYVRREWYERIGYFDTRYRIAADYLSILQLFSHDDFRSKHLPEVMVKMRWGGTSNKSLKAIVEKSLEDLDVLKRFGYGPMKRCSTLIVKNLSKVAQVIKLESKNSS